MYVICHHSKYFQSFRSFNAFSNVKRGVKTVIIKKSLREKFCNMIKRGPSDHSLMKNEEKQF